jgi:hypothetical protein
MKSIVVARAAVMQSPVNQAKLAGFASPINAAASTQRGKAWVSFSTRLRFLGTCIICDVLLTLRLSPFFSLFDMLKLARYVVFGGAFPLFLSSFDTLKESRYELELPAAFPLFLSSFDALNESRYELERSTVARAALLVTQVREVVREGGAGAVKAFTLKLDAPIKRATQQLRRCDTMVKRCAEGGAKSKI